MTCMQPWVKLSVLSCGVWTLGTLQASAGGGLQRIRVLEAVWPQYLRWTVGQRARSTQTSSDARPIAPIQDKEELKQGSGKAKRSGRDRSHRWDQRKSAAGCGEQERGKGKRRRPGLRPSSWDDLGAKMYSILNLLDLRGLIEIR